MLPSFMFLFFPVQRRANIMRIFSLFLARAEWSLWRQMAGRDNICRNTIVDNIFISQESELWTHCRARLRKKVGWKKKKKKFIDCLYIDSFPSALAPHSSHSFLFPTTTTFNLFRFFSSHRGQKRRVGRLMNMIMGAEKESVWSVGEIENEDSLV